ncbi:MAG TPA: GT4 family glycosyltransferase PelF, partial [Candidatus Ventricola intestinavium]|nr:GT4 family glycosyltransferase PelF [Candidatus Ventricola intestinavium]
VIDIGAVVRIVPIKDIKTMLYAFSNVTAERRDVRLHILGPTDENEEYFAECMQLKEDMGLENVVFTGRVDTAEYMRGMDFTLLTSISEGQPLAVLEAMAAGRPAVTTDVGCCRELIEGVNDGFGAAGICVPAMHQTALAEAILTLCEDAEKRRRMGENGRRRVSRLFRHTDMVKRYELLFERAGRGAYGRNRV